MRLFWLIPLAAALTANARQPGEESYNGTIDRVEQTRCESCNCAEVTVILKTDSGRMWVKLGPKPYLEQRDFALFRGDIVSVMGIRYKEKGKWIMLANEIRRGGETLILRGKHGRPEWLDKHSHTCPVCGND
jgi:hypothetical protein